MSRRLVQLGLALCVLAGAASAQTTSLTEGFSLQLNGGLQQMGGLDDLKNQISGMNHYFGEYGEFVSDAQRGVDTGEWAPYLKIANPSSWDHIGVHLRKDLMRWEHSALTVGTRYLGGSTHESSLFHYTVPNQTSMEGKIWGEEYISASSYMLTCGYKLRDRVLPLWLKAELGLGMATLETQGRYTFSATNFTVDQEDPAYGEIGIVQDLVADYDGDTFCADICIGFEYTIGRLGIQLDAGYSYMNFGELTDGNTTYRAIGQDGQVVEYQLINVPDGRYEFVPAIRAALTHMVDLQLNNGEPLIGYPEGLGAGVIDVDYYTSQRLDIPAPQLIEYDLSGPYARFGISVYF